MFTFGMTEEEFLSSFHDNNVTKLKDTHDVVSEYLINEMNIELSFYHLLDGKLTTIFCHNPKCLLFGDIVIGKSEYDIVNLLKKNDVMDFEISRSDDVYPTTITSEFLEIEFVLFFDQLTNTESVGYLAVSVFIDDDDNAFWPI